MPENQELLQHCLDAPRETNRLLVYADWLEQEGDPRSAYARAQLELSTADPKDRPSGLAHLRRLYPVEHPAWCGRFEQAGVFEANLVAVPELWWGVGLGARETSSTYEGFAYHRQPPLPVERFGGDFEWLRAAPERTSYVTETDQSGWSARLNALRAKGYFVPPVCDRLLPDVDLQLRVPSCTDNTFLEAKQAEEHPLEATRASSRSIRTRRVACCGGCGWGRATTATRRCSRVLRNFPTRIRRKGSRTSAFPS